MRISDWSSDVCSSDLPIRSSGSAQSCTSSPVSPSNRRPSGFSRWSQPFIWTSSAAISTGTRPTDRKSVVEGKSVSVRLDLGGGRMLKHAKYKRSLYLRQNDEKEYSEKCRFREI